MTRKPAAIREHEANAPAEAAFAGAEMIIGKNDVGAVARIGDDLAQLVQAAYEPHLARPVFQQRAHGVLNGGIVIHEEHTGAGKAVGPADAGGRLRG